MWLLSTGRAELHFFKDPTEVYGGYAILSHTWGDEEQSFQHILALGTRCQEDGTTPCDLVSSKIRNCCILAESQGYEWVWIDSCCIDKTSSTELSEAINSMFQWYSQAEACYAYLEDVPSDCALDAPESEFRRSRWHTRGWTLQELIAPSLVIFLSRDWRRLGSKVDPELSRLLAEITWIPQVLTWECHFSQCSIAVRMSWASQRKTTRVEDEAYCLMGLFEVNMPTIYGEGRHAFQRLQHEIMKHSSDTSLFAWGSSISSTEHDLESQGLRSHSDKAIFVFGEVNYLLAHSPSVFQYVVYFTPMFKNSTCPPTLLPGDDTRQSLGPFDLVELPKFTVTNYGVECRFPIFEVDGITVAVLLCEVNGGQHVGLFLTRDVLSRDPTRPRYYTGAAFHISSAREKTSRKGWYRLGSLGKDLYNLHFNGRVVKPRWHTIHIVPGPPGWTSTSSFLFRLRLKNAADPPFRIPHWLAARFSALGFRISAPSNLPLRICFIHPWNGEHIDLDLGLCHAGTGPPVHWARAFLWSTIGDASSEWDVPITHDCSEHHIDSWPSQTKVFGDSSRTLRVSFTPCKMTPLSTLIVHLELMGKVYTDMLRRENVTLPPRIRAKL